MAPFLWIVFTCLKAVEPLRGDILLSTTISLGRPGTYLIDFRRTEDWVVRGANQWFWTWNPWIGGPATLTISPLLRNYCLYFLI